MSFVVFNRTNKDGIRYTVNLNNLAITVDIRDLFANSKFQKQLKACMRLKAKTNE